MASCEIPKTSWTESYGAYLCICLFIISTYFFDSNSILYIIGSNVLPWLTFLTYWKSGEPYSKVLCINHIWRLRSAIVSFVSVCGYSLIFSPPNVIHKHYLYQNFWASYRHWSIVPATSNFLLKGVMLGYESEVIEREKQLKFYRAHPT